MINAINFIKSYGAKEGGAVFAVSKDYKGVPVSVNNFKDLKGKKEGEIFAVDGGSAVIADGGAWIISLIRVAAIGYDGYRKIFESVKEFTATVVHTKDKYEVLLESGGSALDVKLPSFSNDEIEDIPAKIMKILEWKEALNLCSKGAKMIVMDSALEADNEEEAGAIDEASRKDAVIIGFCKTSRLRTNTARSFLGYVNNIVKGKEWYYYPIFENENNITTLAVKLNKRTKFCNKVQFFRKNSNIGGMLDILSFFANDSEMAGYPYPLMKADKLARITTYEKKRFESSIERLLRKEQIIDDIYSQTEHSELDRRAHRNSHQKS